MAKKVSIETGIDIWEGLPGSGKSYGAVNFLVERILRERRPVYTNLPLKMRVLQKYLRIKGGEVAAKYIHQISREHFARFIKRNAILAEAREANPDKSVEQVERAFFAEFGPHITSGPDANWIHPTSVLIFDEFHRWADQRNQKDEDPAFLNYVTMHRHHVHWIILLTQNKMQVSIPWRRNARKIIHITDKRNLPFMFGIKLPIPAFAYEEFPAEMGDNNKSRVKPIATQVVFPWLNGGVIWRLYESFTHMGGYRRLMRKAEEVRQEIEGETYDEKWRSNDMAKRSNNRSKIKSFIKALLIVAIVAGLFFWQQDRFNTMQARIDELEASPQNEHAPETTQTQGPTGLISAVGHDFVVIDSHVVKTGSSYDGWHLEDVQAGQGIFLRDGVAVPRGVQR